MCACLRVHATQVNGLTGLWFLADYIIYHIHLYLNSSVKSAHLSRYFAPFGHLRRVTGGLSQRRWLSQRTLWAESK